MDNVETRFWTGRRRPPVLRQIEVTECGLTCLAMLLGYHGRETDATELRQQFPASSRGTSLAALIDIAGKLDMQTRAVRAELDELDQLALPCVLHWNMDHFVLLVAVRGGRYVIHDPARGSVTCTREELSDSFTGVALEAWPGASFVRKRAADRPRIDWRALSGRIEGYKAAMLQVFGLAVCLQVAGLLMPLLAQIIVDRALPRSDIGLLVAIAIGYATLTLTTVCFSAVRSWLVTYIRTELGFSWNKNIFAHLLKLPQSYFEQRSLGDMLSRFNSISSIQQTISTSLVEAALDGVLMILTLVLMLVYSPSLTLIPLSACIVYAIGRAWLYPAFMEASFRQINESAKQQGRVIEGIRAHQTIKVSNAQSLVSSRFLTVMTDLSNAQVQIQKQIIAAEVMNRLVFGFARIGVFCYGAWLALSQQLSAGAVLAFIVYAGQFGDRITSLIDYWVQLRLLNLQGGRLEDIVMAEPERNRLSQHDGVLADSTLSLHQVSYRYSAEDPWVLRNCSLELRAGETVAIVGASGAGKTTLMKMLMGLVEPIGGEVRLGGVSLERLGKLNYRSRIAAVMQDNEFFGGTIAENIALFDPDPDQARIEEAARTAFVHDEITALPMAYRTRIGGLGPNLSAGQRQRVALARALYQRPRVLLLDEATCHVDLQAETAVMRNLDALGIAKIIVTHRRESYARADRILFLDAGVLHPVRAEPSHAAAELRPLTGIGGGHNVHSSNVGNHPSSHERGSP